MAFSSLQATLLVVCLAAAAIAQQNNPPRSPGEKVKDGLYIQERAVTNYDNEPLAFMPNPDYFLIASISSEINITKEIEMEMSKNLTLTLKEATSNVRQRLHKEAIQNVTSRRELFKEMLGMVVHREKLEALERSPVTTAVIVLMDSIINDSCTYMRTELAIPDLNCTLIPHIRALLSQLEMIEMMFALDEKMGAEELGLDRVGEGPGRCDSWQRNVCSPCATDERCDVSVANSLYPSLRLRCTTTNTCSV